MYTQYSLLRIRQQVGLGAKQIAQQATGVVRSGQFLAHDCSHRRLGAVGDHFHGVDQLLAAGSQPLELVFLPELVPFEVAGRLLQLAVDVCQFVFEMLDLFHQFGFAFFPFGTCAGSDSGCNVSAAKRAWR